MAVPAVELSVGNRTVRVTSPDKMYFPDVGLTKINMVEYVLRWATVSRRLAGPAGDHGTLARWIPTRRPAEHAF